MATRKTEELPEGTPFTEVQATAGVPEGADIARSVGEVVAALVAAEGADLEQGVVVTVVDGVVTAVGKKAAE